MSEKKKNGFNLGIAIGVLGTLAGIYLLFTEQWLLGASGTVASAGVAYMSYQNSKKENL